MVVRNGPRVVFMTQITNDLIFLLLVGGKSIRMGEDKAFLSFGKKSNFVNVLIKKIHVFSPDFYLSLRNEQLHRYESWLPKHSLIVDQNELVKGPLCGLISAHQFFVENQIKYNAIFTIAVDTPSIKLKSIKRLIDCYQKNPNISGFFYRSPNGIEPLLGIYNHLTLEKWSHSIEEKINLEFSLQKKINSLEPNPMFIELPSREERFLKNINTKKDFESIDEMMKR